MTETNVQKTSPRGRKIALIAGLSLGLIAVTGAAIAGGPGGKFRGGFPGGKLFRLMDDLQLTEQQEVKMVKARRLIREQGQDARAQVHAAMGSAIDELGKPAPDAQKLHRLADDAAKNFAKVAHAAIDQFLELHATFTPEQRQTLADRAREMHDRRGEQKQGRGNRERSR